MYLHRPHLDPDPHRNPFFTGMDASMARLPFHCVHCGATRGIPLEADVRRGGGPFDGLKPVRDPVLAHWFGCRVEQGAQRSDVYAPDGEQATFVLAQCTVCRRTQALCYSLSERQPRRMVATLHGAACLLPEDEWPAPVLAVPDAEGRWGMSFPNGDVCEYLPRVDAVAESMRGLREFSLGADGLTWAEGHRSVRDLHAEARSLAPGSQEQTRWLRTSLRLLDDVIEPSPRYGTRHEIVVRLRPFDPQPVFLSETIGRGFAAEGGEAALRIAELRDDNTVREMVREAGGEWLLAIIDAHADDAAALQRLVEAAVMRHPPEAVPSDIAAPSSSFVSETHSGAQSEDDAEPTPTSGWWAAPDEPPLYYLAQAMTPEALAEELAVVFAEMQAQRVRDEVAVATTSPCFVSDGTQGKLSALWYDPATGEMLGEWRYTVILRHLQDDPAMDADDLERFAYDGVVIWALAAHDAQVARGEGPPPTVYFRYEYDDGPHPVFVSDAAQQVAE